MTTNDPRAKHPDEAIYGPSSATEWRFTTRDEIEEARAALKTYFPNKSSDRAAFNTICDMAVKALKSAPSEKAETTCRDGCQYAKDVGMPEYTCGGQFCEPPAPDTIACLRRALDDAGVQGGVRADILWYFCHAWNNGSSPKTAVVSAGVTTDRDNPHEPTAGDVNALIGDLWREHDSHQTVHDDDRRRKELFARAARMLKDIRPVYSAPSAELEPLHRQDTPRVDRNVFKVPDPQNPKREIEVVFASFARCIESESNSLRETSAPSATATTGEYICKCGIRVSPHRCNDSTEF